MTGRVKRFNPTSYGFIVADDGSELYVHHTDVDDPVALEPGERVEFDVAHGQPLCAALNVRRVT